LSQEKTEVRSLDIRTGHWSTGRSLNQLKEAGDSTTSRGREEGCKGAAEILPYRMDDRPKENGKYKGSMGGERWEVVKERLNTEEDK